MSIVKIVVATSNQNKVKEINAINKNKNIIFEPVSGDFSPAENGKDFHENAYIKAKEAAKLTHSVCLADDSGLCVDALNGAPGLYSSRYEKTPQSRINKLLTELKPYNDKSAHFICVMVLVDENGHELFSTEGKIFGKITENQSGINGFGYDPIFYLPDKNMTLAEVSDDIKNKISHRANALNQMIEWISNNY